MKDIRSVLATLQEFNNKEIFYRHYYQVKNNPILLKEFLDQIDRKAMDPPPPASWYQSPDNTLFTEYFIRGNKNVSIKKHNRYTPLFKHSHIFFEMIYVLSGICENTVEGQSLTMREGDICILAPNTVHTLGVFDDQTIVVNIIIKKSTFKEVFSDLFRDNTVFSAFFKNTLYQDSGNNFLFFQTKGDDYLHSILEALIAEELTGLSYSKEIVDHLLYTAFWIFQRHYQQAVQLGDTYTRVEKITNILCDIQNNYQTVTLQELAEKFKYTPDYVGKLIKKHTQKTFPRYIQEIRLKKACSMLQATTMSITEIGYLTGHKSLEVFNRTFKKYYNMTPSEYRKKAVLQTKESGSLSLGFPFSPAQLEGVDQHGAENQQQQ